MSTADVLSPLPFFYCCNYYSVPCLLFYMDNDMASCVCTSARQSISSQLVATEQLAREGVTSVRQVSGVRDGFDLIVGRGQHQPDTPEEIRDDVAKQTNCPATTSQHFMGPRLTRASPRFTKGCYLPCYLTPLGCGAGKAEESFLHGETSAPPASNVCISATSPSWAATWRALWILDLHT